MTAGLGVLLWGRTAPADTAAGGPRGGVKAAVLDPTGEAAASGGVDGRPEQEFAEDLGLLVGDPAGGREVADVLQAEVDCLLLTGQVAWRATNSSSATSCWWPRRLDGRSTGKTKRTRCSRMANGNADRVSREVMEQPSPSSLVAPRRCSVEGEGSGTLAPNRRPPCS
jgi:hypothetical protein